MPTAVKAPVEDPVIHVLWINAGLSCDGDSVALTAATQPSIEEIALGALPGLPKVAVHWPLIDFECGPQGGADDFLEWFWKADRGELEPFVLVVEGSIPNEALKDEGYWSGFGNNPLTGQPVTTSPSSLCASSGSTGPGVATGYITVDAVNRCSPRTVGSPVNTPADSAYFASKGTGLASNDNVLWGDYTYINMQRNTSNGGTALAMVADGDVLTAGTYTFYGRYNNFDGRDNRIPLSSLYYARYLDGGAFSGGTDLVVWRDNRRATAAPQACGKSPDWSPMGEMQVVLFDEEENPKELLNSNAFPVVTQKVHVGGPSLPVANPFGWVMLDLWHKDSTHAQGWVGVVLTAEGHFSSGNEALRADDLCNFGP